MLAVLCPNVFLGTSTLVLCTAESNMCACMPSRDWQQAYQELEMQRGYCVVSTRYSPAMIRESALSSPTAFLQVNPHKPTLSSYPSLVRTLTMSTI